MRIINLWWLPDGLGWIWVVLSVIGIFALIISLFDRGPAYDEESEASKEARSLRLRLSADDWEHFLKLEGYLNGPANEFVSRLREFVQMTEEFRAIVTQMSDEDLQQFADHDKWAWNSQDPDKPVSTEFLLARNARLREFVSGDQGQNTKALQH